MCAAVVSEKQSGAAAAAPGETTTPPGVHCSMYENRRFMEGKRTRNYATVVYPESAPCDWKIRLQEQCVPAFVSPYHDKDINEDGTLKKAHYHVMILFEGVKTIEQAGEVFAVIGGVGIEPIKCARAYARYLCHLDNPEKAQYKIEDVISCSGADYDTMISLAADRYNLIGEMIDFCIQNSVDSYAVLLLFAKNNRRDWFRVLCDYSAVTMVQFLKSRYWERNRGDRKCYYGKKTLND